MVPGRHITHHTACVSAPIKNLGIRELMQIDTGSHLGKATLHLAICTTNTDTRGHPKMVLSNAENTHNNFIPFGSKKTGQRLKPHLTAAGAGTSCHLPCTGASLDGVTRAANHNARAFPHKAAALQDAALLNTVISHMEPATLSPNPSPVNNTQSHLMAELSSSPWGQR